MEEQFPQLSELPCAACREAAARERAARFRFGVDNTSVCAVMNDVIFYELTVLLRWLHSQGAYDKRAPMVNLGAAWVVGHED